MTQLLPASSMVALVLLGVHSWRTRGRFITLTFFIAGICYGLIRENAIWLLMRHLTGTALDIKPYVPDYDVYPVGRTGWIGARRLDVVAADGRFEQPR